MRIGVVLALLASGGCSGSDVGVTGWPFDPVQFFVGQTQGEATLRTITGSSHHISVVSKGTPDGKGGVELDQAIREDGNPARTRRWTIRPAGPNRWAGTLTDARGVVTVERTRTDVAIRYRMKNGANVEQHLQQPPGGLVDNRLTVSRFGLKLATLHEHIRKIGP